MQDPTIEFVEIELEGKSYKMAFDLESLCDAEEAFLAQGIQTNLLECLEIANLTGNSARTLFALSLRKAQPELEYEDARKLVTHKNIQMIRTVILAAWCAAVGIDDGPEKNGKPAATAETQPLETKEISVEPSAG